MSTREQNCGNQPQIEDRLGQQDTGGAQLSVGAHLKAQFSPKFGKSFDKRKANSERSKNDPPERLSASMRSKQEEAAETRPAIRYRRMSTFEPKRRRKAASRTMDTRPSSGHHYEHSSRQLSSILKALFIITFQFLSRK